MHEVSVDWNAFEATGIGHLFDIDDAKRFGASNGTLAYFIVFEAEAAKRVGGGLQEAAFVLIIKSKT